MKRLGFYLTISVPQAYCAVTTEYGILINFIRKSTASLQIKISTAQLKGNNINLGLKRSLSGCTKLKEEMKRFHK